MRRRTISLSYAHGMASALGGIVLALTTTLASANGLRLATALPLSAVALVLIMWPVAYDELVGFTV